MNLSILLEDENVSACTLADLPTNSDIINALEKTIIEKPSTSLTVNQLCVVVWQNCDSKYEMVHCLCEADDKRWIRCGPSASYSHWS